LVGLQPDIIVTSATPATVAVQRETPTIPIVFTAVGDPVVNGVVARLNRPGGNVTGFGFVEPSFGGKWLELLTEIAPGLKRSYPIDITAAPTKVHPHVAAIGPIQVRKGLRERGEFKLR
jgi:ABC-type uncharacterized transport system substrate-binding protein